MGEVLRAREFDQIFCGSGLPSAPGKLKLAEPGLGWKDSDSGKIITVHGHEIKRTQWLRSARSYQLRITKRDGTVLKFEGFSKEVGPWFAVLAVSIVRLAQQSICFLYPILSTPSVLYPNRVIVYVEK